MVREGDALGMTEQNKQENVIKGLECCLNASLGEPICPTCTYRFDKNGVETGDCEINLLKDAIALLKAQEPRVMTLEEVKDFNWDYCYLEEERLPGKEYRAVCGDYALTCITWPSVTSMRIQHGDESYGKEWRCWTSRPDKATREATPWE